MSSPIGRGVVAPILTPFNDDLTIATDLYLAHAQRLLEDGCAGLAPFGTTGEALSVGIDERIDAIKALVDTGIDPALLVPGTGLTNIADTARLSQACLNLGCSAVMTLPPFYFKAVTEDGLFNYFAALFAELRSDAKVFLYHIPQVAVVGIPPALTARLRDAFPDNVIGIKDSSGDWENTKQLFEIDGLTVYPGSELPLIEALEAGAPGCISATANLNAKSIGEVVRLFDAGDIDRARTRHEEVKTFRKTVEARAPIPAQKRILAENSGDERWANVRPPFLPMSKEDGDELSRHLKG